MEGLSDEVLTNVFSYFCPNYKSYRLVCRKWNCVLQEKIHKHQSNRTKRFEIEMINPRNEYKMVKKGFYRNGKIRYISFYIWGIHKKKYVKHGEYRKYYEDGGLEEFSNYVNGKRNGLHYFYRQSGSWFEIRSQKNDQDEELLKVHVVGDICCACKGYTTSAEGVIYYPENIRCICKPHIYISKTELVNYQI
jgi:hypothetical protein